MLRGRFRGDMARGRGRLRPSAPEDGRLLPAAARLAFPPRDRFDGAAGRGPFDFGHGAQDWRRRTVNGGGDCLVVGGHFALTGDHAGMLLGILPPIVHIRKESDKAAMRWSLERMRQELREGQPGGFLMAQHLAHLMLLQALRLHLAEGSAGGVGWLFALARQADQRGDRRHSRGAGASLDIAGAGGARRHVAIDLRAPLQGDGRSVADGISDALAHAAGRGQAQNSSDPVSVIARSLGYESESAFSTAFKRVMGCSPRQYGRGRAAAPAPAQEEAAAPTGSNPSQADAARR